MADLATRRIDCSLRVGFKVATNSSRNLEPIVVTFETAADGRDALWGGEATGMLRGIKGGGCDCLTGGAFSILMLPIFWTTTAGSGLPGRRGLLPLDDIGGDIMIELG